MCFFFCVEKRCQAYIRDNLRAPPWSTVQKWGNKMGLSSADIDTVNSNLLIRHQLGKPITPAPSPLSLPHSFSHMFSQPNVTPSLVYFRTGCGSFVKYQKMEKNNTAINVLPVYTARGCGVFFVQQQTLWAVFMFSQYFYKANLCSTHS